MYSADVRWRILSRNFIGRFLYDTRAIKSADFIGDNFSAVELGSNFGNKIARFYRLITSRNKIVRLTSAVHLTVKCDLYKMNELTKFPFIKYVLLDTAQNTSNISVTYWAHYGSLPMKHCKATTHKTYS